jgi:hypothetical protein
MVDQNPARNCFFPRSVLCAAVVMVLIGLLISNVHAGFITIETSLETKILEEKLILSVTLKNIGNEPAYHEAVQVQIGKTSKTGQERPVLPIDKPFQEKLEFDLSNLKPGIHPVIVAVNFTDVNQYPLSSTSMTHFAYKTDRQPRVFGKTEPLQFKQKGKFNVVVKNLEDQPKNIRIRLVLPRELSCDDSDQRVYLKALEEKAVVFNVSNFSALPGANHAVFTLMEYDEKDVHLSLSIPGNIEIITKRKLTRTESLFILSIPMGVLLCFLGLIVYLRKRKQGE